jgi:hypothetical protein
MRVATPYRCDYCGKRKENTNHWWLVFPVEGDLGLVLQIHPWSDELAAQREQGHVCSQACVVTALSKFMNQQPTDGTFEVPGIETRYMSSKFEAFKKIR